MPSTTGRRVARSVQQVARQFQAELARLETQARLDAIRGYYTALREVNHRIALLIGRMQAAQEAGVPIDQAWLTRQTEYEVLSIMIGQQMAQYAASLNGRVTAAQRDAIRIALEQAENVAQASLDVALVQARWVGLSPVAVEYMIANTLRGPLADLLSTFGDEAWQDARTALVNGVTLGDNPRTIAQDVRKALQVPLWRALTITRTEILRAHREATREALIANQALIDGWVWLSAMDDRTCPYCWAMTGTHHAAGDDMASHPNCRCTKVPQTKSWEDLLGPGGASDLPDERAGVTIPDGAEVFADLPAREQERILGPAAYKQYKAGELSLNDLVGTRYSRRWGRVGYTKSLRQVHREKVPA